MISYLRGTLVAKDLARVVIDVAGLGYDVSIPMSTYDRLPAPGSDVQVYTHLHVREDLLQLYGFFTTEERSLFQLLVGSVAGVGPKLALNVLSCMPVATFCTAVAGRNIKQLSRISGIGKRSAERLVMELKDKIHDLAPTATVYAGAGAGDPAAARAAEDAVSALVTLGFKAEAARRTVAQLLDDEAGGAADAEALIRRALVQLNR